MQLHDQAAHRRLYFEQLQPSFVEVKEGADMILVINQDAMVRKSEQARTTARRLDAVMIGAAIAACVLGLLSSLWLTTRILRPLGVLRFAARRLGEGDPKARARVHGRDEIAEVATEFNTMADKLAQYRASSLGELLAAEQQAQAVIDSLPDPVLVFDPADHLIAVNRATETSLRVRVADETTEPLAPAPPEVRALIERVRAHVLAGRGSYQSKGLEEALRTTLGDQEAFLLPRATAVSTEDGGIIGVAILLQDVTRLMRFDELKSNLVATVAHEFRTPLTSLRMALHLCLEQAVGPITEKQADLLYVARQDTERLQQIVDDLLDLSRIQSGRIELHQRPVDAATHRARRRAGLPRARRGEGHRSAARAAAQPGDGRRRSRAHRPGVREPGRQRGEVHAGRRPDRHLGGAARRRRSATPSPTTARACRPSCARQSSRSSSGAPARPRRARGWGCSSRRRSSRPTAARSASRASPGAGSTFWFELPAAGE